MKIFTEDFSVKAGPGIDVVDISAGLNSILKRSGVVKGCMNVTAIGSTASVGTIEFEPGVVEDLKKAINKMAPKGGSYDHDKAWHDGNGHSHVQAAMMGPSVVVPVRNGKINLGTWQQVVVINHDNRSRIRSVSVTVVGE